MLFLAVRAAAEDRLEIAPLRARRVRAAMLRLCMRQRVEGTDGQQAGTAVGDVTELPASLTLGVFRGGKHLFDSPVSGEEVDGGEDGVSVGRGHCNNHGGGPLLCTRFRVHVKITG